MRTVWDHDMTEYLFQLVRQYGKEWKLVSEAMKVHFIKNLTPRNCREHWKWTHEMFTLWSPEEDETLYRQCCAFRYAIKWNVVSQCFLFHSAMDCRARWSKIRKQAPPTIQQTPAIDSFEEQAKKLDELLQNSSWGQK
jgi:hypothetical protein